jgi:hypothetical protein
VRAHGKRERNKCGHFKGEHVQAQATDQQARAFDVSAIVCLAGVARAALLFHGALFKRHTDPRQSQSDQRVANYN